MLKAIESVIAIETAENMKYLKKDLKSLMLSEKRIETRMKVPAKNQTVLTSEPAVAKNTIRRYSGLMSTGAWAWMFFPNFVPITTLSLVE